ncbi:MAG: class I SAM-dependent methyltransferase [Erythrobacter sp.]|uniref:methyltransferase n=1 Tax=Erythrobacter sp. TaxID=1042 RepID=UPI0025E29036|nr:methyltransferase [Erythrobacter sp.]MCL9999271.1 class I SAM-dependent methyltransferase [Erythrobacter sp.]
MNAPTVPTIFAEARRVARALRSAARLRSVPDAARFLLDDMAEDMIERLAFVRHTPARALLVGGAPETLAAHLEQVGAEVVTDLTANPAEPLPGGPFDFIGVLGQLDAVNDLPGALIHLRSALTPGGLGIASFTGGQSLPMLRAAMLAAEPDRPAARLHPMVDARAAPGLLQRAGWKDPVVDTHTLAVRYASLDRLVSDLRDQGLGNALARPAAPLGKAALARARAAFSAHAEADGKVTESFEIVTLTGRRSLAGT